MYAKFENLKVGDLIYSESTNEYKVVGKTARTIDLQFQNKKQHLSKQTFGNLWFFADKETASKVAFGSKILGKSDELLEVIDESAVKGLGAWKAKNKLEIATLVTADDLETIEKAIAVFEKLKRK